MKRLETIASLVTKDAKIIDIGTDHAYLPIYLYKNNITKDITASDISLNVLEYSKKNIDKAGLSECIKLVQSDGFKNLIDTYDEAVIAGMGTNTIMDILSFDSIPNSLIISSHNNLYELRAFMQNLGYKIVKEVVVKEKDSYYDVIKYEKGIDNLSKEEILFGTSNDKEYYKYLLNKYKVLYQKSQNEKYALYISLLEKMLG